MTDCGHGMPSPASCIDCMAEGPLPPAPEVEVVVDHILTAQYDGRCAACGEDIDPGQRIAALSDETYVHWPKCRPHQEII